CHRAYSTTGRPQYFTARYLATCLIVRKLH
ncbi:MAG: hypothetical protein ACI9HK_005695, partial [Pirellulaceae bacterium]